MWSAGACAGPPCTHWQWKSASLLLLLYLCLQLWAHTMSTLCVRVRVHECMRAWAHACVDALLPCRGTVFCFLWFRCCLLRAARTLRDAVTADVCRYLRLSQAFLEISFIVNDVYVGEPCAYMCSSRDYVHVCAGAHRLRLKVVVIHSIQRCWQINSGPLQKQ